MKSVKNDMAMKNTQKPAQGINQNEIDLSKLDLDAIARNKKPSPKLKKANQMLDKLKKNPKNDWFFSKLSS